jgi:hypothetical protein
MHLGFIGKGIIDFMEVQYRNRLGKGVYPAPERTSVSLVTVTPSVCNLNLFFD